MIEKGKFIPSDWDEQTHGYTTMLCCVPNSPMWRGYARGAIYELTRGRGWDKNTGNIKDTQDIAKSIFGSLIMCDQLTNSIRELTAAIAGSSVDLTLPIPDTVDYSGVSVGLIPTLHEHLQALGPIPKAGDTIMSSLQKISNSMDGGMTLDDAIIEINAEITADPNYNYKDYLEILTFIKDLLPSTGSLGLGFVTSLIQNLLLARYRHNDLSLKAIQAQNLRTIANSISAFEPDGVESEESLYKSIVNEIDKFSWLGTAITALEPSPAGETALAIKLSLVASSAWTSLKNLFSKWKTDYLGLTTPKELPTSTVTGEIAKLREAMGEFDTDSIKDIIASISGSVTNISLKCASCGSAAGCNCASSGGSTGFNIPDITDHQENTTVPNESFSPTTETFGSAEYLDRKCKIANLLHDLIVDIVTSLNSKSAEIAAAKSMTQALGIAFMLTSLALVIGELSTPVPLIDAVISGVIGFSLAMANYLIFQTVVFGTLLTALNTRENDLICALRQSTSVVGARDSYKAILEEEGVNSITSGFVGEIMAGGLLIYLFANWTSTIDQLDNALSTYTPSNNCDCTCPELLVGVGTIVSQSTGEIEVSSVFNDGLHRITVYFLVDGVPPDGVYYCESPGVDITDVVSTNNLVGANVDANPDNAYIDDFHLYPPNSNLPTFPYTNVGRLRLTFNSGQSGTVTINYTVV